MSPRSAPYLDLGGGYIGVKKNKKTIKLYNENTLLNFLFLIGRQLIYNTMLVSAMHQHESAIGIHIS